jgi:hypothetical protein
MLQILQRAGVVANQLNADTQLCRAYMRARISKELWRSVLQAGWWMTQVLHAAVAQQACQPRQKPQARHLRARNP